MVGTEYSEAAVEVLDILNHTNKDDVERIPQSFVKFLIDISNKNYKPKFNYEQQINEFNLRKQTRELLGFIYITWWCNDVERENYKKLIQDGNIKKEEIKLPYDVYDIFKNKNEIQENKTVNTTTKINIVEYKKANIFRKTINKILSCFGRKER